MSLATLLLLPFLAQSQLSSVPRLRALRSIGPGSDLHVLASSGQGGRLLTLHGGPPWYLLGADPLPGGQFLRSARDSTYVVDTAAGTLTRVERASGTTRVFALGSKSQPQDVLVFGARVYVSCRDAGTLLRLDLVSGAILGVVDLTPLAWPEEQLALGTMERDGDRLFVQLTLTDGISDPFADRGVLAVIDLPSETLQDVDPLEPGVQGVCLSGAPPHLRMQILQETRTLFVSSTNGILDGRGGIERVDLDQLVSLGYALSEEVIGDLGGFVMTSPEGGYFVFHTDLTASTHLEPFTLAGGPSPGPEMVVFFDIVDNLAYDPHEKRLYLPTRFGATDPGVLVFDTRTNAPLGRIPTNRPAQDVALPPPR